MGQRFCFTFISLACAPQASVSPPLALVPPILLAICDHLQLPPCSTSSLPLAPSTPHLVAMLGWFSLLWSPRCSPSRRETAERRPGSRGERAPERGKEASMFLGLPSRPAGESPALFIICHTEHSPCVLHSPLWALSSRGALAQGACEGQGLGGQALGWPQITY